MVMKNFSVEEIRSLLSDVKNSEEKKTCYIVIGVFVSIIAIAIGIAVVLIKRNACGCQDEYEEYWDEEDEYFDDAFETGVSEEE